MVRWGDFEIQKRLCSITFNPNRNYSCFRVNTLRYFLLSPLRSVLLLLLASLLAIMTREKKSLPQQQQEPNPPIWPPSVNVFRSSDDLQVMRAQIHATQDPPHKGSDSERSSNSFTCDRHFVRERHALLFAPGEYRDLDVQVGYYVHVAGLGKNATDVQFVGGRGPYVPALNKHLHHHENQNYVGTCLDSFWRCAENFSTQQDLLWAVSQAAPLRRVDIQQGNLYLHDGAAYASGGHLANVRIAKGTVFAGGQQQYLFRNVHMAHDLMGGAWSMVQVGCSTSDDNAPHKCNVDKSECTTQSNADVTKSATVTVVKKTELRLEKPFIFVDPSCMTRFGLCIPKVAYEDDGGYATEPILNVQPDDEIRDFGGVRVVRDDEPVSKIQEALDQGKDVILSPGIYALHQSIIIRNHGQVLLGIGFATLEAPPDGTPCIRILPSVSGVRIVGLMLEATEANKCQLDAKTETTLLEWGERGLIDPGCKYDPGAMFDVFVRVGGATAGNRANFAIKSMMEIHSGHVIGDNIWLWRADHSAIGPDETCNYPHISSIFWQSEHHEYRTENGIEVTGNDVTMFGLAVEHANGHQTIWSGERGAVHFYQCEFPYGVTSDFAEKNFRGYLVQKNVKEHVLYAPGIYSNFRNEAVFVSTAIEYPANPGIRIINPFTVKLDNHGGILSVANGRGPATKDKGIANFLKE